MSAPAKRSMRLYAIGEKIMSKPIVRFDPALLFDTNVLLDIGAHAGVEGLNLITRDASRYRTYFPKVALIAPA